MLLNGGDGFNNENNNVDNHCLVWSRRLIQGQPPAHNAFSLIYWEHSLYWIIENGEVRCHHLGTEVNTRYILSPHMLFQDDGHPSGPRVFLASHGDVMLYVSAPMFVLENFRVGALELLEDDIGYVRRSVPPALYIQDGTVFVNRGQGGVFVADLNLHGDFESTVWVGPVPHDCFVYTLHDEELQWAIRAGCQFDFCEGLWFFSDEGLFGVLPWEVSDVATIAHIENLELQEHQEEEVEYEDDDNSSVITEGVVKLQCQREYHVGCLRDHKMADSKELPEGEWLEWFCTSGCIIHGALKGVILGGPHSLTSSHIEPIRRKNEAKGSLENENEKEKEIVDIDNIRWKLLSGASAQEVEAQFLSEAVSIFHLSPSQFEAQCSQASWSKPYKNICTSNGFSLHKLSVSLSKHKMISLGESDTLCSICFDSEDLICCCFCPRAFHKGCVVLIEIPEADWYCQCCVGLHQRDNCVASNDNVCAAGRVEEVDPIEQIFKRFIRIVSISETDIRGCTICKLCEFSRSGFGDRTAILYDQCQREYCVGCLRDHKIADFKELPEGEWFCSIDCSIMHGSLREVILGGSQSLGSSAIDLIRRKTEAKGSSDNGIEKEKEIVDYDNVRWRLLSGSSSQEVEAQLLSKAVFVFQETFCPIIDVKTKQDLIPAMVNGMSIEDHQDYSGMHCAVLKIGPKVVSAGLLHFLGTNAAERPLVATSRDLEGIGYIQALFGCMERMLIDLKVRHLLLPSAEEAEPIWTKKFGFSQISSNQVEEYLGAHLTAFRGTSGRRKPLFTSQADK